MTTKMMKPFRVFAPITRVDKEERIVEGYCYVNAVVGDGINLTRKSMEAATADYMKWGAVRAMHQPVAAGQAKAVQWDDKGALLRAHITDDAEWAKCVDGTYKGFSVGVNPVIMRGNKTVEVQWIENSLVDRPFDADATMLIARAEGLAEDAMDKEVSVVILPETDDAELTGEEALAGDTLTVPVLAEGVDITRIKLKKLAKMAKKMGKVQSALSAQYRAVQAELTRRGEPVTPPEPATPPKTETPPAGASDSAASDAVLQRMTQMETTLTRLQLENVGKEAQIKKAAKKLQRLEAQPAAGPSPIRFPGALERNFTANERMGDADGEDAAALRSKYDALVESAQKEPDSAKRQEAAQQIGLLATQLAEMGGL